VCELSSSDSSPCEETWNALAANAKNLRSLGFRTFFRKFDYVRLLVALVYLDAEHSGRRSDHFRLLLDRVKMNDRWNHGSRSTFVNSLGVGRSHIVLERIEGIP
jgi:hypothetical protein